jgi:hypothetical protein
MENKKNETLMNNSSQSQNQIELNENTFHRLMDERKYSEKVLYEKLIGSIKIRCEILNNHFESELSDSSNLTEKEFEDKSVVNEMIKDISLRIHFFEEVYLDYLN